MTYVPKVYKTSGGDTLNVASGGEIQIAGTAFITSGGGVALASLTSGNVTFPGSVSVTSGLTVTGVVTANGGIKEATEAGTSSGGVLTGYGVSSVKSTNSEQVVYTITPAVGYMKYIVCGTASASTAAPIVLTTGTFDGTNKNALFTTGNSNPQWLHLQGVSTSRWYIISKSTDVTLTNT